MKQTVSERLAALRAGMKEAGVYAYMVPTADFHGSEYVAPYFKAREYLSGFTGSAGTLLVLPEMAGLWTDGRYFIQAANELEGSGITLFRMGEPKVPSMEEFLKENMPAGSSLGFDGRCISINDGEKLEGILKAAGGSIRPDLDLVEKIWEDRPALPCSPVFVLDEEKYAGESAASKLAGLRGRMKEEGASAFISSKLDEIMWLYNIRGGDVECNPVALCYTLVTMNQAVLFIQHNELNDKSVAYMTSIGVTLMHYHAFAEVLSQWHFDGAVMVDPAATSFAVCQLLTGQQGRKADADRRAAAAPGAAVSTGTLQAFSVAGGPVRIIKKASPLNLMKAVKNETEIRNIKDIYIEDSAALTKFIFWVKKNVGKIPMTEGSAAAYLDGLRAGISDYVELSFPTISAYGANAAMMHYSYDENGGAEVLPEGMLLVDSGGQYLRGTTDVTRTISLGGKITEEMRRDYTLTAWSQLQMMDCVFLHGANGMALDVLAREPMWKNGMDYKCGTGHGIGYLLNVHEGPHSLRYRKRDEADETPFEAGMVVSDEPGVYKADKHGIRIETILLTVPDRTTPDGTFLKFEPLTFVPLDRELLDVSILPAEILSLLNAYHKMVYDKISGYLAPDEKAWLKEQCAEIYAV